MSGLTLRRLELHEHSPWVFVGLSPEQIASRVPRTDILTPRGEDHARWWRSVLVTGLVPFAATFVLRPPRPVVVVTSVLRARQEARAGGCIIVEGTLPEHGRKKGLTNIEQISIKAPAIEIYSSARNFTITGEHVLGTPETIEPRQAAVDELYAQFFGRAKDTTT